MYEYAARCDKVIDGDTLDVLADVGFGIHVQQRIRLLGINCPEHGTVGGDDATAYTKAWLEQHGPDLVLRTVKDRREKFGRYLGQIIAGGRMLNNDLVTSGHAVDYDGGRRTLPWKGEADPAHPVP
ncbi:thermonuclease family protein [Streptomyces cylindrosporus]|uniref:Thermonuclease family protein n=1 Tax=Streptomyces cylindrosporus TaxID=2927583 RepID=A0ABS9YPA2_9ACTN|nr:thermonuclease family protein [Streptomyces cylindrosporus]MCI3279103.1 thermonuclease family protein [Streptomyces cylindrosporus]